MEFVLVDVDLLYISLLLNIFLISLILMQTIGKLPFIKKRKLSKAKERLNNHIAERKRLIREIRKKSKLLTNQKIVYGFPWWPWFR